MPPQITRNPTTPRRWTGRSKVLFTIILVLAGAIVYVYWVRDDSGWSAERTFDISERNGQMQDQDLIVQAFENTMIAHRGDTRSLTADEMDAILIAGILAPSITPAHISSLVSPDPQQANLGRGAAAKIADALRHAGASQCADIIERRVVTLTDGNLQTRSQIDQAFLAAWKSEGVESVIAEGIRKRRDAR